MKAFSRFSRPGRNAILASTILAMIAIIFISTPALAAPGITISPSLGTEGTTTEITGALFDSYKGDTVYVFFNNVQVDYSPFSVPDSGTFKLPFVIPDGTPPGTYQVKATSDYNGLIKIAETTFTVEATTIYLDITRGPVGTTVTISGTGFYAGNDVTVFFYTASPVQAGTATASDAGRFDFHYVIPNASAGLHSFIVTNTKSDQAQTVFDVTPVISVSQASGGPGEFIKGTGSGFGASVSFAVMLGTREIGSGVTDELGYLEFSFYVPNVKANLYELVVQDDVSNTDSEKFTVTAGAALSASIGAVGSELTVRGDGFIPGGTVAVSFGDTRMTTVTADNNGGFVTSFIVPKMKGGLYTVTVSDGLTEKEFPYTIEMNAPSAPPLLLPANNQRTGFDISFDWQDVTDDSPPVTYDFQLAHDQAFSSLMLDKTGLTTSAYTPSSSEKITAGEGTTTFYWRVRAVDGALNNGEWAGPWSFSITPPDAPILHNAITGASGNDIYLDWEDAVIPDGTVTYILEISSDQSYTALLVQEEEITTSNYTVTGAAYDALESDTPYYWRVKAVSAASGSSDWSQSGIFSIAASPSSPILPTWAIIAIAAIGVIIIAYLAFRMGRKTSPDRDD